MRLEIILSPKELEFSIPVNYNYLIYNSLNQIFSRENSSFETWMFDDVCRFKLQSNTKLFTFSKLLNNKVKVLDTTLSGYGNSKLVFSAPLQDRLVPNFIKNLWRKKGVTMFFEDKSFHFSFRRITPLPEPEFSDEEKFVMLSPTAISKPSKSMNYGSIHFYRIHDYETPRALAYNLRKKYRMIHQKNYYGPLYIHFDHDYISAKGGSEGVSKLITIKQGTPEEFRIKGFVSPLTIKAHPDLIKIAYQCGIGERNTLGMGMIEKANEYNLPFAKEPVIKKLAVDEEFKFNKTEFWKKQSSQFNVYKPKPIDKVYKFKIV